MIELVARTSALLALTWLASSMLSRATAATRHVLWHLAIIGVLAAPVASLLVPKVSIVPALAGIPGVHRGIAVPSGSVPPNAPGAARTPARNPGPLVMVWLLGSAAVFVGFSCSHAAARGLVRRSRCSNARIQSIANEAGKTLGLTRPVPILVLDSPHAPCTSGIVTPVIVMPVDAALWSLERLRRVLLHELAHVRRRDCRVQSLAQIACAVYWFNPLVWLAARTLRATRERACDDEVLAHGAQPSAYASDLLEIARGRRSAFAAPAVLAIARAHDVDARLRAILARDRARTPRPASRWAMGLLMFTAAVVSLGADTIAARPPIRTARSARSVPISSQDRERAALLRALDPNAEAIPALITALQDPDSQVREKAALGLGWRQDARVLDPLIVALHDEDSQVREKAAIALGSSGQAAAVGALQAARNDPNEQVREKAEAGLLLLQRPGSNRDDVRRTLSAVVQGVLALTR